MHYRRKKQTQCTSVYSESHPSPHNPSFRGDHYNRFKLLVAPPRESLTRRTVYVSACSEGTANGVKCCEPLVTTHIFAS